MTVALDQAFGADDPFGEYWFPNPERRKRAQPRLYRAMIRHQYLPLGGAQVAVVGGQVAGALLWQPPGYRVGLLRYLGSIPEFTWAMGSAGPRVLSTEAALAKLAPGLPHFLGITLGVDPRFQGSGVGKALSLFILGEVERARVPLLGLCKDGNLGFYAAFGGQRLGKVRIGRSGPEVNVMMWLPSSLRDGTFD
ncbi:GNAT family N-acetyltransferase [Nocardia sp. XZ_19_385]|uniref:GNAT family N-acetyltransferase n=1 Tax=Nocardia sp. XZ_19_385 TaxID=2769488 RepID=UPI0018907887|nr:GNAT family N-acetyltransferase [Nocardia sp. XZ_19_385]